jgi:predicted transcriptional regulator
MKPDPDRKPRSDARLKNLAPAIRARIAKWAREESLKSVSSRCASELGITIGLPALSSFLRWQRAVEAQAKRKETLGEMFQRADANAKAVAELLKETGATADQLAAAEMLVFQMQSTQAGEATTPENLALSIELEKLRIARDLARTKAETDRAKLRHKDEELRQSQERLTLLQFDASRAALAELKTLRSIAADRTLSEPEKVAAVRLKLFGTPKTEAGKAAAEKGAA